MDYLLAKRTKLFAEIFQEESLEQTVLTRATRKKRYQQPSTRFFHIPLTIRPFPCSFRRRVRNS